MTTEVPGTDPTDATGSVDPGDNHNDGTTGNGPETVLTVKDRTTLKPDNNHNDSESA